MLQLKTVALAAIVSATACCLAPLTHAADAGKFDIAGITLGMSPEEALKALRAHGVNEQSISESRLSFGYSDGLSNHRTEDFTHMIVAHADGFVDGKRRTDTFNLFFSPPPKGGKLVAVRRTIENRVDPVTNGQFRAAVLEKYGAPTVQTPANINWQFDGGNRNCLNTSPNGIGIPIPDAGSRNGKSILDMVYARKGGQHDYSRFQTPRVVSLDDCASMLQYNISPGETKPATRVSAEMIDVKNWFNAELATKTWIEGLRQKAVKQREGSSNKPVL
ncbi:MAG: hypothetical protein C0607_22845 [Azoarcus sp.]|nr:MAG: hypothetical protein C0607_22845 [Azoarcus sp.]